MKCEICGHERSGSTCQANHGAMGMQNHRRGFGLSGGTSASLSDRLHKAAALIEVAQIAQTGSLSEQNNKAMLIQAAEVAEKVAAEIRRLVALR